MTNSKSVKYLMLIFSGPLQAWGKAIPGVTRSVEDHPTKSGVVGFLGACLGIALNESDKLRALSESIKMACRVDAPGHRMTDFHVVQNTYTRYSSRQPDKWKPSSILSFRDYLCNAVFTVCVSGENIEVLYNAVREPVHVPYLGRKSCLPNALCARIIEAPNIAEAFNSYSVSEVFKDLTPILSTDTIQRVYWEGSDDSIPHIKTSWKYDSPSGVKSYRQRKEYMGYITKGV